MQKDCLATFSLPLIASNALTLSSEECTLHVWSFSWPCAISQTLKLARYLDQIGGDNKSVLPTVFCLPFVQLNCLVGDDLTLSSGKFCDCKFVVVAN